MALYVLERTKLTPLLSRYIRNRRQQPQRRIRDLLNFRIIDHWYLIACEMGSSGTPAPTDLLRLDKLLVSFSQYMGATFWYHGVYDSGGLFCLGFSWPSISATFVYYRVCIYSRLRGFWISLLSENPGLSRRGEAKQFFARAFDGFDMKVNEITTSFLPRAITKKKLPFSFPLRRCILA